MSKPIVTQADFVLERDKLLAKEVGLHARQIARVYDEMIEENDSGVDPREWTMGPDTYDDLLDSLGVGHRQLRAWVKEDRVGETVRLTVRGAALFSKIEGILK